MNMGLLGAIANTVKTVKAVKGAVDQVKGAIQNAQGGQAQGGTTGVTGTTTGGSTGGTFLPGIGGNNTTQQKSNVVLPGINTTAQQKLNETKQYFQSISNKNNAIQNTKSNVVLPGINTKPAATISPATKTQERQSYIYASNNNIDTQSINEKINEEMYGTNKVLGQIDNVIKTYIKAPLNNYKKAGVRALWDSGIAQNFIDKTFRENGINLSSDTKSTINKMGQELVMAYTNEVNDRFRKIEEANLDPKIKEKYDNKLISELIGEGDFAGALYKVSKGTSENWQMIPQMAVMALNPAVGLTVMGTDVYIQENQGTFEDMMANGATYEQARNGAIVAGAINAGIELLMERFLGGVQRAGASAFRRLFMKDVQKEIVATATKKGMSEIIAKGLSEIVKGSTIEGFEEVLQTIVGNAMVKFVNPERGLTEGSREAFEGGFFNLFNAIGGGVNMYNDSRTNKQIDMNADIEALNYVMESEQRKAEREEKRKRRNEARKGAKNWGEVNEIDSKFQQEENNVEMTEEEIENEMIEELFRDDEGDFKYQKKEDSSYGGSESSTLGDKPSNELSPMNNSEELSSLGDQARTSRVNISPEKSSEITQSLNEIKNDLDNLKSDTFLEKIKKSISGNEKGTNYMKVKIDGKNYVLRIADHSANGYQFDKSKQNKRNTSIVIKLATHSKFKKNKNVDLVEFVYDPANMTTKKMQGIIDGIQNWLQTGQYTDTNYDGKNESTRTRGQNTQTNTTENEGSDEYAPGVASAKEKTISAIESLSIEDFLQGQTVEQFAEKYGIPVHIVKQILTPKGKKAYGAYGNGFIRLAELIKESTAPHELLHAVFDMIDPETRVLLISNIMKSEGLSAPKAEEWLADSFSNFFRTGKIENAPKSTWGHIKKFFKRVRTFINGMDKYHTQIEKMFRDILEANGIEELQSRIDEDKSLNRSKEKMRERFERYKERAERRRNRRSNEEEKYQEMEDEYEDAVNRGDTNRAKEILKQYAEEKGYLSPEDYKGKGAWVAPSASVDRKDFRNLDAIREQVDESWESNLYAVAQGIHNQPDDYFGSLGARYYSYDDKTGMQSYYAIKKVIDNINAQIREYGEVIDMPVIEVYRAVPDYKEKIDTLQKDLELFTFDKEGNPKLSDASKLSEEGKESYEHYKDQEERGVIDDADKLLYETTKGAQEISDKWTVKEGMLQSGGEWVSPSIDYAKEHGMNRFDGNYKIIKEKVPVDELWWDGNDIREWGFDDGRDYVTKGVKNSRKNIEITYDDNGNLIPLSERFNENVDDTRYQEVEYDYDEEGNRTNIKFPEDNNEFDPSIFGEPTREEQMVEDKENLKDNPYYDAWIKYNNQNYKDDQLTFDEFMEGVEKWSEKEQDIYEQKMKDLNEAQNDPKMLELQLKAVKLLEEEQNVGKKFGKNVSKEVRDRQQAEVEKKREDLTKEIYEWMYPGLSFEEATYDDMKSADEKEADWELLGKENIEEKLKYFKKDKNGNWEAKNIKIESPQEKRDKIVKAGRFDEVFEQLDRVIEWRTPEGKRGRLDSKKDLAEYKKTMEKINAGNAKTKVTLRDVTAEQRALEKTKTMEEEEKARKKKEREEAFAKKKQDEYKKIVIMKAFQRLVDMQRFEKYPFLTEEEIKNRYGFSNEEWKKITEQEEIKVPKKWGEKAISDLNKAVDSKVRDLIEGLSWQNNMKRKDAEKDLGEIGEIDLDVLLGRDEEKGQKEVEEFERVANEEMEGAKEDMKKRMNEARENVMDVEIDKERENDKSEKERLNKIIKSSKSDQTVWGSIKKTASDIITPVSTRIREISPKIYRELMRYFQNKDILTNQRLKEIDPFLKAMGKIRKENPVRFMDIWVALANRNIGYANGLLQEYGVKVPTELLDTIYDEVEDVGLNMNYLGSYYPLSVKAPKSFMEELTKTGKGDIASEIDKRIAEESARKGGPLEEAEVTAIINSVIAGEEKGPDVNLGNKHMKKRNTEIERTEKMLEYCDDPISTLITYIEGMTDKIERAKFLGKSRSGNVHTLADYVYNVKNGLDSTQQDELMELLKSVFNDASPDKFYQTWRDIATLTTLGSPSSTLTQIGDLSFSIYENGWREALKATWDIFMKRNAFDLKDMGVINRGEEYTNINSQKNLLQKAIHNVFKLTFFSNFDTFGKSTFIQSTWNKRRKRALKGENGDPQLIKDIMKITDDEYTTMKIINDLRNGVFSEDVALVMYMKLGNIQPLTKAQMPKAYLDNPNGRLFYQFKTFGIKQLDYVLQETKEQTKGFKNLSTTEKFLRVTQVASMIFIMTLMGAGASELKDISMRRRSNSLILRWLFGEEVGSEQIWDKIGDSALQLFGLSRYTVMQMKSDPVDAITNLFTTFPATNLVMYPFKDINKAFKNDGSINWRNPSAYQLIPVIGKYWYWIYGGGQDKQQQALEKENKAQEKYSGSSRRNREDSRKNRDASRKDRSASRKNRSDSRKNR